MKIANVKRHPTSYDRDIERIVQVMEDYGYICAYETAYKAWTNHSEMFAAGWLSLPEADRTLFHYIKEQLEDDDND